MAETMKTGSSAVQAELWSPKARDWADVQEATVRPLYDTVFQRLGVGSGTQLLDVGCGSGLALAIAEDLSATVSGLDATPALAAIARNRLKRGKVEVGEMEDLPYADQAFDAVTGFNAFQYAASPVRALGEARRVVRIGGSVVIAVWGTPEETDASAYIKALGSLLPPPPAGAPGPFALSADGSLERLVTEAGFESVETGSESCPWAYPDLEAALRGLLSAGPAVRAIRHAGEEPVRDAVSQAIAPFKLPSGSYLMQNRFRFAIAKRAS